MSQHNATVLAFPPPQRISSYEPAEYFFNELDRDKYGEQHVRLTRELALNWARLWREHGGTRGGGTITSLLPVLMLHSYPSETTPHYVPSELPPPNAAWTHWSYLSTRRLSKVAGLGKNAGWAAIGAMARMGLLEHQTIGCHKKGGHKRWYRLSRALFGDGELKKYAKIAGHFLYSGTWSILPSPAARHLYLLLAMLDPVYCNESLTEHYMETNLEEHADRVEAKLLEIREAHTVSVSSLARMSGMSRGAVKDALAVLLKPIFGDRKLALVKRGGGEGYAAWYAIERRATTDYSFFPDFLNDRTLREIRAHVWHGTPPNKTKPPTRKGRRHK